MKRPVNILLIDDDNLDRVEVQRTLDRRKILYRLKIARNGEEGLLALHENSSLIFDGKPDIILLDINMPKMNGVEFLQAVRSDGSLDAVKIFILTTSEELEDKAMAVRFKVTGFITKPLKLESPSSIDAFNLMIDLMNLK